MLSASVTEKVQTLNEFCYLGSKIINIEKTKTKNITSRMVEPKQNIIKEEVP